MYACLHAPGLPVSDRLLDVAAAFSPRIEETAPDTVLLDVRGLERVFGPPRDLAQAIERRACDAGLRVHVAVAPNPDACVHAARGFSGITVILQGQEARTLARLPLDVLGPSPEIAETLERWGIRTCGELVALPEDGLAERLGTEGVRLQRLARGTGDRPLVPAIPPPSYEESLELEHPVTLLEPLSFLLARMLGDICARLESHGQAANELRLRLGLDGGGEHARSIRLPFPMRDARTFLRLLQFDLDAHPPQGPVMVVALAAEPVDPRVVQHGLFIPLAPEPQKLELTLARIGKLVGQDHVGSAEMVDTHRPGAFRMTRFAPAAVAEPRAPAGGAARLALRVFRPPLRAEVQQAGDRPAWVAADGLRGKVLAAAGPWRTSGDWWHPDPWDRDEWDVALGDGALYRIYHDHIYDAWFVEGTYD